jgi:DnaK suppressor protein
MATSVRRKPKGAVGRNSKPKTPRKPASSQDVLGTHPPEFKVPPKWKKYYQRLSQLREEFLGRKGGLISDARAQQPAFSLHMADAGTDNFDRDFALSMISSDQNALYEIEGAISRIRDGSYGTCELTGKPIPPERLEALPWTRFSADAEKQLEREGAVASTRLGRREEVQKTGVESPAGEGED